MTHPNTQEVPVNAQFVVPAHARTTIFDALVSAVWDDGVITMDELEAARAAARELGLAEATLSREVARPSLHDAGKALGVAERELVVAAMAWILAVDGLEPLGEAAPLVRAADSLEVPPGRRVELAALAAEVRATARHATSLADEFSRLLVAVARARTPA